MNCNFDMEKKIEIILDLISQIKKAENQIAVHKQYGNDQFHVSQYEEIKERFFKNLISETLSAGFAPSHTINLISLFGEKFYGTSPVKSRDLPKEAAVIYRQLAA